MGENDKATKVAVSYSWKTEKATHITHSVKTFCERLEKADIDVLMDKKDVSLGDNLSDFMREVGESDVLCVFLSPAYLESPNCMFELWVAWDASRPNGATFQNNVKVWTLPGMKIDTPKARDHWVKFWKQKLAENEELLTTDPLNRSAKTIEDIKRMRKYSQEVDAILTHIADHLTPDSFEAFVQWAASEFEVDLPSLPEAESAESEEEEKSNGTDDAEPPNFTPEQLDAVFDRTVSELEKLLRIHDRLAAFLQGVCASLFQTGSTKLSKAVRERSFEIYRYLEAIADNLDQRERNTATDRALREFTGGLAVLGFDSGYIQAQRERLPCSIEYPGIDEQLLTGNEERPNFLYLLSCALGDSVAKLDRLFGPELPTRVPPPPAERRGILEKDTHYELKAHFVKCILGAEPDKQKIEEQFTRVKDRLRRAIERGNDPYVATGEVFWTYQGVIHSELGLAELYIIRPRGSGLEDEIFDNPFNTLEALREIYNELDSTP